MLWYRLNLQIKVQIREYGFGWSFFCNIYHSKLCLCGFQEPFKRITFSLELLQEHLICCLFWYSQNDWITHFIERDIQYYYLSYRSQVFPIKFSGILEGLEIPLENSLMAKLLVILEWATPAYSKFKVVLNSELSYHVGTVSRLFSTFFQENPCFFQIVYSVYFQHSLHK